MPGRKLPICLASSAVTKEFLQWVTLSKACKHEDTPLHTFRARDLDRPPSPSLHPSRHNEQTSGLPSVSATTSAQAPSSSAPTPTTHAPSNVVPNPKSQLDSYVSIPGPRCPSDPPDQIYDDWGGEWFRMRAQDAPMPDSVVELNESEDTEIDREAQLLGVDGNGRR